jgi:hypothetical protein
MTGVTSRLRSLRWGGQARSRVLRGIHRPQKLVINFHQRVVDVKLFVQAVALESQIDAIAIVGSLHIVVADVRILKPAPERRLCLIPEKLTEFAEVINGTWSKVKALNAARVRNGDVDIPEAIISVESDPVESYF